MSRLFWFYTAYGKAVWHALSALTLGAIWGALAGLRYDLVFGCSEAECATVQTLIVAVCWTYAGLTQPYEVAVEV